MKKNKRKYSLSFYTDDKDLYDALVEKAKKEGRSLSQMLRIVIREYLLKETINGR